MDALLLALQNVCSQLLPVVGTLALIFLCVLLKKTWILIDRITETVKELDPTIKLTNKSIEKAQAPLDTVVKYSHSLDKVHDKTTEAFGKAFESASENVDHIKEVMSGKINELDPRKGDNA